MVGEAQFNAYVQGFGECIEVPGWGLHLEDVDGLDAGYLCQFVECSDWLAPVLGLCMVVCVECAGMAPL